MNLENQKKKDKEHVFLLSTNLHSNLLFIFVFVFYLFFLFWVFVKNMEFYWGNFACSLLNNVTIGRGFEERLDVRNWDEWHWGLSSYCNAGKDWQLELGDQCSVKMAGLRDQQGEGKKRVGKKKVVWEISMWQTKYDLP
jgi:hypothetical protein